MSILFAAVLIAAPLAPLAQEAPARPSPRRPATGAGPTSSGPEVVTMFNQVVRNWRVRCDDPNFVRQRIQFDLRVDADGRIVSGPTPVNPQEDPYWQAAAAEAREALLATAPFDVPAGFQGGVYRPTFNAEGMCQNRQAPPDKP